jgi:hypothetical protein
MPTALHVRKLIAILCLTAIFFAALAPGQSGLASALLVPFWLFVELLALVSIQRRTEDRQPDPFPLVSTVLARAPPVQ